MNLRAFGLSLTAVLICAAGVGWDLMLRKPWSEERPRRSSRPPVRRAARVDRGLRYAHTVAEGETLSAVAARGGVPLSQLIDLNRLADPDRIRPGTTLILRPLPSRLIPGEVRVDVFKARRSLELRIGGAPFKCYRVGLGNSPAGDKQIEGDGRTPEGDFYVCQKLPAGDYGPSLGLSYPNLEDARRGRRDGLISAADYRAIAESSAAGSKPPWDTSLGGAICIHGRGGSDDWTAGCIALDDADAGELFALVPMGAAVTIRP